LQTKKTWEGKKKKLTWEEGKKGRKVTRKERPNGGNARSFTRKNKRIQIREQKISGKRREDVGREKAKKEKKVH